jgi:hypothetical protein
MVGMRYDQSSQSRLVIDVADQDVEQLAITAFRLIVPRYCRKVYFLPRDDMNYNKLIQFSKSQAGFTFLQPDTRPSNLYRSFRLVHNDSQLVVAAGQSRLNSDDWKQFADSLGC